MIVLAQTLGEGQEDQTMMSSVRTWSNLSQVVFIKKFWHNNLNNYFGAEVGKNVTQTLPRNTSGWLRGVVIFYFGLSYTAKIYDALSYLKPFEGGSKLVIFIRLIAK